MERRNTERRAITMVAALAGTLALSLAAQAQDVRLYKRGEVPDPADIARMLNGRVATSPMNATSIGGSQEPADDEAGAPIRTRGIRLTSPLAQPSTERAPQSAERAASERVARDPRSNGSIAPATGAAAFAIQVQFPFNSAELQWEMLPALDAVADGIKQSGIDSRIVLEGHTDGVGAADYNLLLSRRRAEAVRNYFVHRHGLPPEQFSVVGRGKFAPLLPENPFAAENRRVQFRVAELR